MTIDTAANLMKLCAAQMDARYKSVVFDEWALVRIDENRGQLLAYLGPRREGFQRNFLADVAPLRQGLLAGQQTVGDFEFSRDSVGTSFESIMSVGTGIFLICNNTVQSMDTIARNPLWLNAQVPFVELSDRFRIDPVALAPAVCVSA